MTNITYTVSITNPQLHLFDVELKIDKWEKKTIKFKNASMDSGILFSEGVC